MTRGRAGLVAAASLLAALAWIRCGPLPPGLLDPARRTSTEVVDRAGVRLYEARSPEGGRTEWLAPDRLPPRLVAATLAAEDRRFFLHPGVDPIAVVRAAWRNLAAGGVVEGGSTITQQAVKQLSARRRTMAGKLSEMLLALRLEHRLGKREILALYLNLAPYGNQYAGAAAAARGYFGCDPENLTVAQAAFLAGLPRRPGAFDPYRNLPEAAARQRAVLARMEASGLVSADEARWARQERLRLTRAPRPWSAPHFVERVLADRGGRPPRRIETTLDAALQAEVAGILASERQRLRAHGAYNVAVAVLDNRTAEWLAWEGSGDFADAAHGGAIDGVVTPRQPGSALKPFTYALAFESGLTPASVLPDVPSHFPTAEAGVLYGPRNYDGAFRGPMRARMALAGSVNVPAVWALSHSGVPNLLRLLRRAGFSTLGRTPDFYGFGLTMGDAEVRLDELVGAYAAFASGGVMRRPRAIRAVAEADGAVTSAPAAAAERLVSERTAWWITDILSDARARAFTFGTGSSLDFPFPVAVKTGTSQAYRDNWTVGYTREVTVGVWVGNFDRGELRNSSGVTGAAPIFHAVMLAAEKRVRGRLPADGDPPIAEPPPGLAPVPVCSLSGMRAAPSCPRLASELLPADGRLEACTWHRAGSGPGAVAWPAEYRAWAAEHGLLSAGTRTAGATDRPGAAAALRIESPPPRAVYLRDPTLRKAFQAVPLRASAAPTAGSLTWRVDGRVVGAGPPGRAASWSLEPGRHAIEVVDDLGGRDETTILVK